MTIAEQVVYDQRRAEYWHEYACRALAEGRLVTASEAQMVARWHALKAMEGLTELLYRRY